MPPDGWEGGEGRGEERKPLTVGLFKCPSCGKTSGLRWSSGGRR